MPIPKQVTRWNKRFLNPLTLRLAGRGSMVELEHVGRVSGRRFRTPLMPFRDGETVTVALTYGPDVQWLANVTAAGRCRMRMAGRWLTLGAPRPLAAAEGLRRMPQPQRVLLRTLIHCREFVALPVLDEEAAR
jgi:deazaflavin-dependent oxidoreductase (nitroreductase family)